MFRVNGNQTVQQEEKTMFRTLGVCYAETGLVCGLYHFAVGGTVLQWIMLVWLAGAPMSLITIFVLSKVSTIRISTNVTRAAPQETNWR